MRKRFLLVTLALFFSLFWDIPLIKAAASSEYIIDNFASEITINQDTSLTIKETITVNFSFPKHGIFRIIPVIYTSGGKTIKAKIEVLSVTNEQGESYQYTVSPYSQSIKIQIGDPQKTITGSHTYIIGYTIDKVLLSYDDHEEFYWNVTGHEWDATIKESSAVVKSPWAEITKVSCFAGQAGGQEQQCNSHFNAQEALFSSKISLRPGDDFTIVVALSKDNQLNFPGLIEKIITFLTNNWGYLVAIFPFLIMFIIWYKKGRDRKYLSDNHIYYRPDSERTEAVSPFHHKYLPMVYSPIDNLTPAQVGTIIDEKVDIQDVVAEIVELARLGYLQIKKIEERGLIGKKNNYFFIKEGKDEEKLKDYQQYLLTSLFATGREVSLSSLKNDFYLCLPGFKRKLYDGLVREKIFFSNPEKTKNKWLTISILAFLGSFLLLLSFADSYANFFPMVLSILFLWPTLWLAKSMPRRTAWGYSLYRQAEGLHWYIGKGKWREEIAEKHLFLEEILPLAISLGVVDKLTKDMADLNIKPPDYFGGVTAASFHHDLGSFYKSSVTTLASSPSGKSSWSGGSGFSGGGSSGGGSSGGGFGGGGGGSW